MPGLGHVYIGRFGRALIWFAGALIVGGILSQDDTATWVVLVMVSVLAVFAALDAILLVRGGAGRRPA